MHHNAWRIALDRTNGYRAFQVIGLDFAEPMQYRRKNKSLTQACILLISCSLSIGIHTELVNSKKLEEFI